MKFLSALRKYDWPLTLIVFVLILIGLSAIYSVDLSRGSDLSFFPTQLIAFGLGAMAFLVAANLHLTVYQNYSWPFYFFSLFLLLAVLFFGVTVRGTTGWFRLFGFSFQPAELAKVGAVMVLAWLIARYGRRFEKVQFFLATGILALVPIVLILLQPDLGSALVVFGVWFGLAILAGIKKRYIALVIGFLVLGFLVGWLFLFADYQKERLLTFVDSQRDPLGAGYNVTQSIIAVGSGQFFGRGLGFGSQSQLHFLPEAQTDFIFSVIAEELGFLGVSIVLLLFFLLLWRLVKIAAVSGSEFGAYAVLGIVLLFLIQLILNIGGAIGLLPITGVTLPFISQGGSSLIINLFLIGIASSIAKTGTTVIDRGVS